MVLVVKALGENCSILKVNLILIEMIQTTTVVRCVLRFIQLYFLGEKSNFKFVISHVTLFSIGVLKSFFGNITLYNGP